MTSENSLILPPPFSELFFSLTEWNVKQVPLPSVDFQKGKTKQNKKALVMFSPTEMFSSGLVYLIHFERHLN